MEQAYEAGKVRAIGLSNFNVDQIEEIMSVCKVRPTVLQTELHPYNQEPKLKKLLKENGIVPQAWYPLGHGDKALLNEPLFAALGEKYGKSTAQIILRWELQKGIVVIPKSVKQKRVLSNMDVFDFELEEEDMQKIDAMDVNTKVTCARPDQLWPDFLAEKKARMDAGARF